MTERKGRCLCGAVTYTFEGPALWVAHCHCESCRRNTSSAFTTYVGVPRAALRFTGTDPAVYGSSPGVRRLFCPACGAPVAYESDRYPGEIHVYLAALEDGTGLVPTSHVFVGERVPWVTLGDNLPKHLGESCGPQIED